MRSARTEKTIEPPATWDELSNGHRYRLALEQHLQPWWPKIFGVHLLKLGTLSIAVNCENSLISHHINAASSGTDIDVYVDNVQLPFLDKSLDACLMANTLGYSDDPHRILREVDRVLIDDGWLIISGFNPLSLIGIAKLIPFIGKKHPYCSRMFTVMRMIDWLSLLNYEVLCHQHFYCNLEENEDDDNNCTALFGNQTLIIARKRTIPLTLNPLSAFKKHFTIAPGTVSATKNIADD